MTRSIALALAGAALAAGLAIGVALTPQDGGGITRTVSDVGDEHPVATATEPGTTSAGTSVGFARTERGARDAALVYATASQRWLYLDDAGITAAVHAIATDASADRLAREVVEEVGLARDALATSPGRVWWFVRPLAWDIVSFTPDRARVEVWVVTVLSAADVAVPQADWITVALDLRWEDGGWRADDVRDEPGPTPVSGTRDEPWEPEPFDDALAGFERVDWEVP